MTSHITRSSFFGLNNVKSREELKAIGNFAKDKKDSDDWGLGPSDALFVPILSNSRETHISNLKGFSDVRTQNAVSSASNRRDKVVGASSVKSSRSAQISKAMAKTRVGIYSRSAEYCRLVEGEFERGSFECNYFGLSKTLGPKKLRQALSIDIWIVNLNDDDETEALDTVMEICAERTALFLVERAPTSQCFSKLHEFLDAA